MDSTFAFQAIAPDGSLNRGTIDAADVAHARSIVAARGMFVVAIEPRGTRRSRREPLSPNDLALGLRVLGDLLEAGLPVSRALHIFHGFAPSAWRTALPDISQSVREGKSFTNALATAPLEIPPLVIGIAQAGEAGSDIGRAIRRAAELSEASAEMRSAIRASLAYPMAVAWAAVAAVTVLITVVLPRLSRILSDPGQTLPASTQRVLRVASLGHAAFIPGVVVLAVLIVLWHAWTRTPSGRAQWHRALLAVPVLGEIRRGASTARMAYSLAALLESGVPIATAMGFAARAAGDAEIEARLTEARGRITSGQPLSWALESSRAVTLTAVRLVRAGEESGRLPSMLSHAARIEQQRVDRIIKTGVRMLEPLLLLTFASVVAIIAAALLQAIYGVKPI
jgi:type II secretory pathway component PulF